MTRAFVWLALSLTLVLGMAGCDLLGGSDDAGGGGAAKAAADAGAKPAAKTDLGPLIEKLANNDLAALEEVKKLPQEDGHQLIALLKDEDATKRKAAAFAARAMPSEQHSEALAPVLDAEKDPAVAKVIVETLQVSGDAKAVAALVGSLGKGEAQAEKIAAVAKLGDKLGDNKAAAEKALLAAAAKGDHQVAAIAVLGDWKSAAAKKDLVKLATKSKDPALQAAALRAVGAYGDKKDLKKVMYKGLKSKKEGVRIAAIEGIAAIGHKSAIPKLRKASKKDKSKKVKAAAKAALKTVRKGK